MLLARSAEKPTRNYDIECSNHHPSLSTPSPNGVNRGKIKWWAKYRSSPVDVIVRLPHPWRGDRQGQETFLAPSADKQSRHYDIEGSKHSPWLSTLGSKGFSLSKMKRWAIYKNLPVNVIIRLPHPRRGDSKDQETFLAPPVHKQTRHYDIECSKHHPWLSTLRPKGLSLSKMKWWDIYTNLPVDDIVRLPHPRRGDS